MPERGEPSETLMPAKILVPYAEILALLDACSGTFDNERMIDVADLVGSLHQYAPGQSARIPATPNPHPPPQRIVGAPGAQFSAQQPTDPLEARRRQDELDAQRAQEELRRQQELAQRRLESGAGGPGGEISGIPIVPDVDAVPRRYAHDGLIGDAELDSAAE
jgi:hypothetical protein